MKCGVVQVHEYVLLCVTFLVLPHVKYGFEGLGEIYKTRDFLPFFTNNIFSCRISAKFTV